METVLTDRPQSSNSCESLFERTGALDLGDDLYEVEGPGIVVRIRIDALRQLSEMIEYWQNIRTLPYVDRNDFRWCCRLRMAMREQAETFQYTEIG